MSRSRTCAHHLRPSSPAAFLHDQDPKQTPAPVSGSGPRPTEQKFACRKRVPPQHDPYRLCGRTTSALDFIGIGDELGDLRRTAEENIPMPDAPDVKSEEVPFDPKVATVKPTLREISSLKLSGLHSTSIEQRQSTALGMPTNAARLGETPSLSSSCLPTFSQRNLREGS